MTVSRLRARVRGRLGGATARYLTAERDGRRREEEGERRAQSSGRFDSRLRMDRVSVGCGKQLDEILEGSSNIKGQGLGGGQGKVRQTLFLLFRAGDPRLAGNVDRR
jgi:hypothetical protein